MLYRPSEAVSFGAARYAKGIWKEIRAGEKSGKKQPSSLSVSRNPVQKISWMDEDQRQEMFTGVPIVSWSSLPNTGMEFFRKCKEI